MSFESPFSVLFDSNGTELSVTSSQTSGFAAGNQPGIVVMGSSSLGAQYLKLESDGTTWITGSVSVINNSSTTTVSGLNFDSNGNLQTALSGVTVAGGALTVTGSLSVTEAAYPNSLVSGVNASTTNFTVLAANSLRGGASFFMNGNARAYVKLGAVASTVSFTTILRNNTFYEVPAGYTGQIDVLFNKNGAQTLHVTEISQ